MSIGLYDWVIATDHTQGTSWIISQGLGSESSVERFKRATERADQLEAWLAGNDAAFKVSRAVSGRDAANLDRPLPMPQHYVRTDRANIWSNFSSDQFRPAVAKIVAGIGRGDTFQVNLAQRLLSSATLRSAELYLRLRQCNPAPYGGFYSSVDRLGEPFQVLSSSPEGFLQVRGGRIETRPIKGTVARTGDVAEDLRLAKQLSQSEKDRAENTMIVDLMRNDLSRVCTDESIKVTQLCRLEQYQHVQHLVSVVQGELQSDKTAIDALKACFPGGSVTGAPKIEAMRTIAESGAASSGPLLRIAWICQLWRTGRFQYSDSHDHGDWRLLADSCGRRCHVKERTRIRRIGNMGKSRRDASRSSGWQRLNCRNDRCDNRRTC